MECVELWNNMLLSNYNIVIEIEYKCKVEHVYVVPYEYHWECYEMVDVMLKCGHDIRLSISGCVNT